MTPDRTLKVDAPHMTGADVELAQTTANSQMKTWGVDHRVKVDGDYGVATRDVWATVLFGLGIDQDMMAEGLTPELRVKVRNKRLTAKERARYHLRAGWRVRLRHKYASSSVAPPLAKILSSSWGYHPPVHDGVDLICAPNAQLYAICDGTVIRADAGGWWGKGAPSASVAAKGDGIIVIRCTTTNGPFRPGLNFCYGHAEHPVVKAGQHVKAGEVIGRAGMAVAWHVHAMVNARGDDRGLGDRDPMPYVRYAMKRNGA
jgi:murein DD-endopeptidase MepM/ murein hydrolase activator NlpD